MLSQSIFIRFLNLVSLTRTLKIEAVCSGTDIGGKNYNRCNHMMTDISCVLCNSCARHMIKLQCWVGKDLLTSQGAMGIAKTKDCILEIWIIDSLLALLLAHRMYVS